MLTRRVTVFCGLGEEATRTALRRNYDAFLSPRRTLLAYGINAASILELIVFRAAGSIPAAPAPRVGPTMGTVFTASGDPNAAPVSIVVSVCVRACVYVHAHVCSELRTRRAYPASSGPIVCCFCAGCNEAAF
jgi:hypothetical protein